MNSLIFLLSSSNIFMALGIALVYGFEDGNGAVPALGRGPKGGDGCWSAPAPLL